MMQDLNIAYYISLGSSIMEGNGVSPTVFREAGFRFFFFSLEESRMHIHVHGENGEAKFWIEPRIELARNYKLPHSDLSRIETLKEEHENVIRSAWHHHFGS